MRLSVTQDEFITIKIALKELLSQDAEEQEKQKVLSLIEKLNNQFDKSFETKAKKRNATKKATNVRIENAKNKIRNAINMLMLENKKITIYSVSKESGVSFNTVKKYRYLLPNSL